MKLLLAGLALVAATVGAGLGYAGMHRAAIPDREILGTQQAASNQPDGTFPEGYVVESTAVYEDEVTINSPSVSDRRYEIANDATTVIPAGELNQIVTEAIASQPYTAPILETAKSINTAIKKGRIESGAVINLADLPIEAFPAEGRQAVEQLTQTFPFLANRDVYVGIEGKPKIVEGALSLDDTHIRLGQLKLPVGSVAKQLGLSQSDIEQQINSLLSQQGLSPSDVQIVDGQLVIQGQ